MHGPCPRDRPCCRRPARPTSSTSSISPGTSSARTTRSAPLSNPEGEPTHAMYGTVSMLHEARRRAEARATSRVAMDSPGRTFRDELDARYKAHRPPPPPTISPCRCSRCEEIVEAYRIPIFIERGPRGRRPHRGRRRRARRRRACASSSRRSDKDLMQLVDERPRRDVGRDARQASTARPRSRRSSASRRRRCAICSRSSATRRDNVPGVPGVGLKTAAELLEAVRHARRDLRAPRRGEEAEDPRDLQRARGRRAPLAEARHAARRRRDRRSTSRRCATAAPTPSGCASSSPSSASRASSRRVAARRGRDRRRAEHATILVARRARGASPTTVREARQARDRGARDVAARRCARTSSRHRARRASPGEAVYVPDRPSLPRRARAARARRRRRGPRAGPRRPVDRQDRPRPEVRRGRARAAHGIPLAGRRRSTRCSRATCSIPRRRTSSRDRGRARRGRQDRSRSTRSRRRSAGSRRARSTRSRSTRPRALCRGVPRRRRSALATRHAPAPRGRAARRACSRTSSCRSRACSREMEHVGVLVDLGRARRRSARRWRRSSRRSRRRRARVAGHELNLASPQQLETILFDELKLRVVTQDQDRPLDRRRRARGARRRAPAAGHRARAPRHREAQGHVRRRAAAARAPRDGAHPHALEPGGRGDRAALVAGPEPAEHPDPHRARASSSAARSSRPPGSVIVSADYSQIELRVLAHLSQDPGARRRLPHAAKTCTRARRWRSSASARTA